MPEVQCRVLIAGYQENPGSDTWHHLGAERRCVPILWLALDVAASLFCPDNRSFSDRDLIHLGKPGELDRVYFQVNPLEKFAATFKRKHSAYLQCYCLLWCSLDLSLHAALFRSSSRGAGQLLRQIPGAGLLHGSRELSGMFYDWHRRLQLTFLGLGLI